MDAGRDQGGPAGLLLDGYVRVSQVRDREGPSFISPEVQREQIEAWAKLSGARIGKVFEELNQSGGRSDRPKLLAALERIEGGASQGLVVAKLDRFGRSLLDGLSKIDRIIAAGGVFVSVQDGLDLTTPTGKLVLRIMLSMAEWELDRIRANWDLARGRAVGRGVFLGGLAPFGYRRGRGGRLCPDPEAAALVRRVFAASGEGATHQALADMLNESGLRTPRGSSHFTAWTVARMLRNRVYLGEVKAGDRVNPDAHPALVDVATWQGARRPTHYESHTRASLLGAILRCGSCRLKMSSCHGGRRGDMVRPLYHCSGRSSAGPCPDPARVRADDVEGLFEELAFRAARRGVDRNARARIIKAEEALAAAEQRLLAYRDDSSARSALGSERFAAGLAKRAAEVERRARLLAGARAAAAPPTDLPADLEARWPELDFEARRETIEGFVDCAFVMAGPQPARERLHVCMRGEQPADVPGRGCPLGRITPFDPASARTVSLPQPALWGERRIERELREWRGEQTQWPSYGEFLRDGRARLFLQVIEWGGHIYWSHRLGWEIAPLRRHHWDRRRVRGALRPYLKGRETFPTMPEFEALGARTVRAAALRYGGIEYWAAEFGVAYSRHPQRPRKDPG